MGNAAPQFSKRLIPNPPLRDQAYAMIKDAILSGRFEPGRRLVEQETANLLGLSRSPVREAFRRLEQEGYLKVGRAGVIVEQVSIKDVHDLYFVRQRLEGMACALAAERTGGDDITHLRQVLSTMETALQEKNQEQVARIGYEFHTLLYSLSDNRYLMDTLILLSEQIRRFRSLNVEITQRGLDALKEHHGVVDAIARHDVVEADRLSQEHVNRSWEHTRAAFENSHLKPADTPTRN